MRSSVRFVGLIMMCVCSLLQAGNFALLGGTVKDVALFEPGEEITFLLRILEDDVAVAGKKITWTLSFDGGGEEKGEGIAGADGLEIVTSMDHPGFIRLQAKAFDEDGTPLQGLVSSWGKMKTDDIYFDGGAGVSPEMLRPIEEPEDFDEFWEGMRAKLAAVPMVVDRVELESQDPQVKIYAVTITCAGAMPVTGYLTIPADAKPGSLKAVCSFHGYGVNKHKAPTKGRHDEISFNINAHGMTLGESDEYYAEFKKKTSGYAFNKQENSDPETAYFHDMSLRVMRALEFVKSLPEWNGRDLESNGGSQGGLQGLWGAGIDPDVTSCNNWSPWCCDLGGVEVGRMKGWRPEYSEALAYYDPVYHVKRTQAKIHLIANLGDYTCPPSGVWIVYNQVPHDRKSMEVKQGCTHSYTMDPYMSFTVSPEGITKVGIKEK
ncbi:acetylxylan esterase [Kiritimatiellota bacterium B12222]|nr:acetylxylan esterase [Kiritimatiellota bacterium B12222]